MMTKKFDTIFIISIFVINILIRLPFLNLQANYDETNYLGGVMKVVASNLNPITYFWGYKPPVMFEPVAVAWKLFGESLGWARLFIYVLSSVALVYTFLLGKLLFDRRVAVFSTLMLFCFPLFMMQSLLYQDAVPLTAFFIMTLYYFFKKDYLWYLISAVLLVLTKEVAIFIPFFLYMYDCFRYDFDFKRTVRAFKYLVPLLFFLGWMCLNKLLLGWFLWPFNVEIMDWSRLLKVDFDYHFHDVFFDDRIWLYTSLILAGWLVANRDKRLTKNRDKNVTLLFIFIFLFYFVFCFLVSSLTRYILFAYVLVFLLTSYYTFILFRQKAATWVMVGILVISILANIFLLVFRIDFQNGDRDLRLFSNVALNKKAVDYVWQNYDNPVLITVWPMTNFFDFPIYGYIEKGYRDIEMVECRQSIDTEMYEKKYPGRKLVVVSPLNLCVGRDIGANSGMDLKKIVEIKTFGTSHFPVYIYDKN